MEPKQGDRRETLRVLVVEENEARRDEIRGVLSAVTESELEVGETATLTSSSDADVAIVLLDGSAEGALRTIQRQSQNEYHPIMFAVVQDYSTGTMRRALSAGADEVLRWPLDPGDVTRALLKVSERRRNSTGSSRSFLLLTVCRLEHA